MSEFRYVLALTRRRRGRPNQQGGVGHLLPSVCGGEGNTSEEVEYLGAGELIYFKHWTPSLISGNRIKFIHFCDKFYFSFASKLDTLITNLNHMSTF